MTIKESIDNYVNTLASNETQTSEVLYILVYLSKDELFHHSYSTGSLSILIDNYYEYDLTPEQALDILLKNVSTTIGAIYRRNDNGFEILVKEVF